MKLSEFKGDEAIIVMADLLIPITNILGDKETKEFYDTKPKTLEFASFLLKNYPKDVICMIAILNRVDISDEVRLEEFKDSLGLVRIFQELTSLINDPDVKSLFHSQGLSKEETSSISAMENIEA